MIRSGCAIDIFGGSNPPPILVDFSKEPPLMKVWIDQDLCTGDGICVEIAPDVFTLLDDGLAYVKDGATIHDPGGPSGLATVPESAYETTVDSAEECPGECIFIEVG